MEAGETGAPAVPGYAVTRLLGRGAGSEVWAAVEEATGGPVAVKVADPTAHPPGELRSLAAREIAVLDRVTSDHVLRLRTAVTLPTGAVALVLDLAEGGSLADLVAGRGRLADGEVVTICTALATALASLHEAGVIHGDLAAGNVLFTGDGKPLVADFATARLVGESDPPLVAGTAGFVAPEVARGDIPTEASDAYGVGALAWFALTGRPRTVDTEPGLAEAVGFLGRRLGPVVAPLLAPDPADRPGLRAAAGDFYRAAAAVPVTLQSGAGDPAAALTYRIRASAHEQQSRPSGVGPSVKRPAWTRSASVRLRQRRVLTIAALAVATVAALALGKVAGLLTTQPPAPVAAATSPSPARGTSPDDSAGTLDIPGSAGAAGSPRTSDTFGPAESPSPSLSPGAADSRSPATRPTPAEALRADPAAVLSALANARAVALASADPAALLAAAAPDSPMYRSDAALLAALRSSQTRYAGVGFSVRSAEVQGGADDGHVRVRAVIDRSGYRLVGPGPTERSVLAEAGAPYVYGLVLVDGQWRLADIT